MSQVTKPILTCYTSHRTIEGYKKCFEYFKTTSQYKELYEKKIVGEHEYLKCIMCDKYFHRLELTDTLYCNDCLPKRNIALQNTYKKLKINNGFLFDETKRGCSNCGELRNCSDCIYVKKKFGIIKEEEEKKENKCDLWIFENKQVDAFNLNGETWFKAKQVAEILGYSDPNQTIRKNVHEQDRKTLEEIRGRLVDHPFSPNEQGQQILINEPGIYSLVLKSKKPEARKFERWVTTEVLPTIRKRGIYMTEDLKKQLKEKDKTIDWLLDHQTGVQDKSQQQLAPKPQGYIPANKEERIKREMTKKV